MSKRDQKHADPYKVIDSFFSFASMNQHRKYIYSMLETAYSEDYWRKSEPAALLYFQGQMEKLMRATHTILIRKDESIRRKILLADKGSVNQIPDPATYFGNHQGDSMWHFFPRNLSKKEFIDPFLVFERFFRFMSLKEWVNNFNDVVLYAFSSNGNESALELDYLKINQLLQKLVEAAHLIQVRLNK